MSGRAISERRYSARVMRFRGAVYGQREGLTNGCRLLLLRLSDGMDGHCKVSVPRSTLAAEFGVAPARITEWVRMAKELGFLDTVRRGRPGVTAVYQGLIPAREVRPGVPSQRYARADQAEVRPGVPSTAGQRYATAVPQEVVRRVSTGPVCECHGVDDCISLTDHREASA
jgi:hypothetical protein